MKTVQTIKKMKHALRLTVLAVLILVVSGCQAIPQDSGVHTGLDNFAQAEQEVVYRPDMPVPDANQEDIVRGFLQAASSSADDYQVARQFLTSNYQNVWNPYSATLIDEGTRKFTQITPTQTKVTLNIVTNVDEAGIMNQVEPNNETEVHFELRRENGQWRIQSAPNAIILDRTTFKDVWSAQQLFFWAKEDSMVAESRWFINRGGTITHMIDQLIKGPQPLLQGSLYTAFPHGVELSQDAVILEAGVAQIDVTSELLTASPETLTEIKNQLATTLHQIPGVTEFKLTVNKAEVLSGFVSPDINLQQTQTNDGAQWPAVEQEGTFGLISPTGFLPQPELGQQLTEIVSQKIITRNNNTELVVQTATDIFYIDENEIILLDSRENLLEPTVDMYGYVWSATKNNPEKMTITLPGQSQTEIEVPWLEGLQVRSFKVSPDGTKMAFLIDDKTTPSIIVTGIVRSEDSAPNYLVDPGDNRIIWLNEKTLDMDWIDTQLVAVLEVGHQGTTRITTGGLGVFPEERTAVQNAVALHGGTRLSRLVLLDDSGHLWVPQGSSGWQKYLDDVTLLSKRS